MRDIQLTVTHKGSDVISWNDDDDVIEEIADGGIEEVSNERRVTSVEENLDGTACQITEAIVRADSISSTVIITTNTQTSTGAAASYTSSLQRVLLGATTSNVPRKIYWEFGHPALHNRHMLIFGTSGMGKTYAIQCILCEIAKFKQNSLVIDYTEGFLPKQLEELTNAVLHPVQHVIRTSPLPMNPFLPYVSDAGGITIADDAAAIASRVSSILKSVYQIGEQQYGLLYEAIIEGIQEYHSNMNFSYLLNMLQEYTEDKNKKNWAYTLINKIRPFVDRKPFSYGENGYDWDKLFLDKTRLCNVFQLTRLDREHSLLVTEFVLWDLYGYLQSHGKKTDPKVIVLDEVQNLNHDDDRPLAKYLREGRKFGVSLILATQTLSSMKKEERDRIFMAAHKLFFKPAETEFKTFAEIAALSTGEKQDDWVDKLRFLGKGECYSIGPSFNADTGKIKNIAVKIRVSPLADR